MADLALTCYERAKYEDARNLATQVLVKGAKVFDNTHPTRLSWLNNLAVCLQEEGQFDAGVELKGASDGHEQRKAG
jgi:hypothetical protein